jgi:diguanylate cyclase (GGDEF)-like protein
LGTPGETSFLKGFDEAQGQEALTWAHKQGVAAPDARPCKAPPGMTLGPCQAISLGPPGVVALIARGVGGDEYSPHDLEAVQFLMRHIHLALHNHVRFATVSDAARRDSLTGLLNAQVMHAAVAQAVTRASREGSHCAVVFLDLDGFKQVNDVHGHLMGSRLLVELAGILSRSVRDCDVVSRFGGDEFVILLTDAPQDEFLRVANRLRARVDGHTFLLRECLSVHVTVSVGLAVFPADGTDATELLRQADMAMYKAKNNGKNAVVRAGQP